MEKTTNCKTPQISVHFLGTRGCGRRTLARHWLDSSVAAALMQFAEVQISISDVEEESWPCNDEHSVFLIIYRSSQQQSVEFAKRCHMSLSSQCLLEKSRVFLLENVDSLTISQATFKFPDDLAAVPLFSVDVTQPVQLPVVFEHVIIRPLFGIITDEHLQQITGEACASGQCSTLKLLVSFGKVPTPKMWIRTVMDNIKGKSILDPSLGPLMEVAEFSYHLNKQLCLSVLYTQLPHCPQACLLLLHRLSDPAHSNTQQLLLMNCDLKQLPGVGVANAPFTQISLAHNKLRGIPDELMQLTLLTSLDISHNNIEQLPSILSWYCPKLRELNISHNSLTDNNERLFKRSQGSSSSAPPLSPTTQDRHTVPQQKLLALTGHNLYSCVHSLSSLDLSHNPRLTKLSEWVCVLPNLVLLNLEGLPKLKVLPQQLALWNNLAIIKLDPDKMTSPSPQVCQQGSQAIVAYLRSQLKGSMHYRHMKLMVLGRESAGKSSVFYQLFSQADVSHIPSSMVVASFDYRPPVKTGKPVKVTYHLISFAEQAQLTGIYRCFLIKRCVYMCIWNTSAGQKGIAELLPWLQCIYYRVPRAAVILVGTYTDDEAPPTQEEISQWQEELFSPQQSSRVTGLPQVAKSVLVNTSCLSDIEMLKGEIYSLTMAMVNHDLRKPLMDELVPRSYIELQSLVETKVKLGSRYIMSYEQFIDSYRMMGQHSWDCGDDEEEFNLACQFLHDAGVIVQQCSSDSKFSSLFFLSPQWLNNTLSALLNFCSEMANGAVLEFSDLQQMLEEVGVQSSHHQQFVTVMEHCNILVALDLSKSRFLLPHLLSRSQPKGFCKYDLTDDALVLCTCYQYLPEPVFPQLQTRALQYLFQLGAQLLALSPNLIEVEKEEKSPLFKVDHNQYIVEEEEAVGDCDIKKVRCLLRALSVTTIDNQLSMMVEVQSQVAALTSSLNLPTFPISQAIPWVTSDKSSRSQLWKGGMHVEFRCGSLAWLEVMKNGIAIIAKGNELARVKIVVFLSQCLNAVVEENYPTLRPIVYSPCPNCLASTSNLSFADEHILQCSSGTTPVSALTDTPQVTTLGDQLPMFPADVLIRKDQPLSECPQCHQDILLENTAPHLLLVDYSNELELLDSSKITFAPTSDCRIGRGGYSDVYRGCYGDTEVAVKVFRDKQTLPPDVSLPYMALRNELAILINISHSLILPPLGVVLNPWSIVFELAPLGSLQNHIDLCPSGLEEQITHQLLYKIASGLQYLHSLHIIHRDVKPSNILVWSLSPSTGVSLRITDCGLSLYSTPSGLRRPRGTEEYMAPELLRSTRNYTYTEKVDIFSFGVLSFYCITGSKPISQHSKDVRPLCLSESIALALDERKPRVTNCNAASPILQDGQHPAARNNKITACVKTCMEQLLLDCLSITPSSRPSACSIAHHLLFCRGPQQQNRIILPECDYVSQSCLSQEANCVISLVGDRHGDVLLVDVSSLEQITVSIPLPQIKEAPLITVAGGLIAVATQHDGKLRLFRFPSLEAVGAPVTLPATPSCLFSFVDTNGITIIAAGTTTGYLAHYQLIKGVVTNPACLSQVLDHMDPSKNVVKVGIYHDGTILCGCGRYLIGLDSESMDGKFIKPLTSRSTDTVLEMTASGGKVWACMKRSTELVVCSITTGNEITTIDCRSLFKKGGVPMVSTVTASPDTVWVGIQTGHLFGFSAHTHQLLVSVSSHSCVDTVVCVGNGAMMVFGRWVLEETAFAGFTVWQSHINMILPS